MLIHQKIVDGQEDITCKLLIVSGLNGRRRIRLTKEALSILKWLGAKNYYFENYMRSHRSSNGEHTIRSARFAESVAMFMVAGYEFRPHKLPQLQSEIYKPIMGRAPVFYSAKLIKTLDESDVKKTGFTRMTGTLLANKRAYIVYNTRNELMKGFDGGGESSEAPLTSFLSRISHALRETQLACFGGVLARRRAQTTQVPSLERR